MPAGSLNKLVKDLWRLEKASAADPATDLQPERNAQAGCGLTDGTAIIAES